MTTGSELDMPLQQLADEHHLVAVDLISMGRVVLTFEDGSEVIVSANDPDYTGCTFRFINGTAGQIANPDKGFH